MKRLLCLVLAMALCLAACTPAAPAETTAPAAPTYPAAENPVNFFSMTLGEDYENIRSLTAIGIEAAGWTVVETMERAN